MRVFVYEFITGGGMFSYGDRPPENSLLREGAAMVRAVARDFMRLPDVDVVLTRDDRWDFGQESLTRIKNLEIRIANGRDHEAELIHELSRNADWTLLIAPEFDHMLLQRALIVEQAGGRLLSPGSSMVSWASDKHETVAHWERAGVPVPQRLGPEEAQRSFPVVVKPIDGAGSLGVRHLRTPRDWREHAARLDLASYRVERHCPGLPASVSVITGPAGHVLLPPCRQRLSEDGEFRYLGGETIMDQELSTRAQSLARHAASIVEGTVGYFGIDLILGPADDGSQDVAIELNPRITTSYIGLRVATRRNLAQAMLDAAAGLSIDQPRLLGDVRFSV